MYGYFLEKSAIRCGIRPGFLTELSRLRIFRYICSKNPYTCEQPTQHENNLQFDQVLPAKMMAKNPRTKTAVLKLDQVAVPTQLANVIPSNACASTGMYHMVLSFTLTVSVPKPRTNQCLFGTEGMPLFYRHNSECMVDGKNDHIQTTALCLPMATRRMGSNI